MKPRDVEIHETGATLFHPRRMGEGYLEQIALYPRLSLGRPLADKETGDAPQSCHSMSTPSPSRGGVR